MTLPLFYGTLDSEEIDSVVCLFVIGNQMTQYTVQGCSLSCNVVVLCCDILPNSRRSRKRTPRAYDFSSGLTVLREQESKST